MQRRPMRPTAAATTSKKPVAAQRPLWRNWRMGCVAAAGVAASLSSVLTDEITDLYALQQVCAAAASFAAYLSFGTALRST